LPIPRLGQCRPRPSRKTGVRRSGGGTCEDTEGTAEAAWGTKPGSEPACCVGCTECGPFPRLPPDKRTLFLPVFSAFSVVGMEPGIRTGRSTPGRKPRRFAPGFRQVAGDVLHGRRSPAPKVRAAPDPFLSHGRKKLQFPAWGKIFLPGRVPLRDRSRSRRRRRRGGRATEATRLRTRLTVSGGMSGRV